MAERIYCDRSRVQLALRCRRARYWEYHAGPTGKGIIPKRKSIHLVIGLAFHSGVEVLLKRAMDGADMTDDFVRGDAENNAVQAALGELAVHLASGVEVDLQEQPEKTGEKNGEPNAVRDNLLPVVSDSRNAGAGADSPIVIDFSDAVDLNFGAAVYAAQAQAQDPNYKYVQLTGTASDFSQPIYPAGPAAARTEEDEQLAQIQIHAEANEQAATGVDDYLKLELAALVEAMIRAYARRRLRPLISEFEIFEVEKEGSWKLGEISKPHEFIEGTGEFCFHCNQSKLTSGWDARCEARPAELWWMSRHDGLLLERQTQQLYLLSYKTTGAWDRRKKADAEIDMQGLSEAVDVEKRLGEAWEIVNAIVAEVNSYPGAGSDLIDNPRLREMDDRVRELVSTRIAVWLRSQPAPPRILGVRYEYILKGARRQDKRDPTSPGRYVQDSPLVRAYRSDGITAEDRRWAPSYEWQDSSGKTRRIDYRSWKKSAVWELMPIAAWVDMLDQGDYWPGKGEDFDDRGSPVDILADQFVPPVTVWRQDDDLRDLIEQLEAQEVQVALDVAAVKACGDDQGQIRSELNRRFQQNRNACVFPGLCSFMKICYGGEDIRRDPLSSGLYTIREANHPIENIAVDVE